MTDVKKCQFESIMGGPPCPKNVTVEYGGWCYCSSHKNTVQALKRRDEETSRKALEEAAAKNPVPSTPAPAETAQTQASKGSTSPPKGDVSGETKQSKFQDDGEPQKIRIRKNQWGNYEHRTLGIVFNTDKVVIGIQNHETGLIDPLTEEGIKFCDSHLFPYLETPPKRNQTKSTSGGKKLTSGGTKESKPTKAPVRGGGSTKEKTEVPSKPRSVPSSRHQETTRQKKAVVDHPKKGGAPTKGKDTSRAKDHGPRQRKMKEVLTNTKKSSTQKSRSGKGGKVESSGRKSKSSLVAKKRVSAPSKKVQRKKRNSSDLSEELSLEESPNSRSSNEEDSSAVSDVSDDSNESSSSEVEVRRKSKKGTQSHRREVVKKNPKKKVVSSSDSEDTGSDEESQASTSEGEVDSEDHTEEGEGSEEVTDDGSEQEEEESSGEESQGSDSEDVDDEDEEPESVEDSETEEGEEDEESEEASSY
jgi:hypothetical protein